jgi:putative hemolysin
MKDIPAPTMGLSLVNERRSSASHRAALPRGSLHPSLPESAQAPVRAPTLEVQWAEHLDEVRAAQRLRHAVFAHEMGAQLPQTLPGHDIDRFDDYCEHLLVRLKESGEVVGTYRLLTPAQAQRAGGLYSDTEFELGALDPLRPAMVELGRSCVHSAHRSGAVIMALWGALAQFMERNRLTSMVGCASIPMWHQGRIDGRAAASIWHQVRQTHLADPHWQVSPRLALPVAQLEVIDGVEAPALIKGYLRLGAKVLGAPAWDPDFNTADLPMLMRIEDLPSRYRKHFLGA